MFLDDLKNEDDPKIKTTQKGRQLKQKTTSEMRKDDPNNEHNPKK